MLRIRSIREPEVEDRRAGRLPDHRDFPFRDERVIGNLFIGDLNARRRLLENEERRSAQHEVQRVLGVDPAVDETLKLGFGRRRGLRRSPHSQSLESHLVVTKRSWGRGGRSWNNVATKLLHTITARRRNRARLRGHFMRRRVTVQQV